MLPSLCLSLLSRLSPSEDEDGRGRPRPRPLSLCHFVTHPDADGAGGLESFVYLPRQLTLLTRLELEAAYLPTYQPLQLPTSKNKTASSCKKEENEGGTILGNC